MQKTFIIAEAGVNHNGDMKFAYKLIDAAVSAQADAVKFQTFISEKNISKKANKAKYQAINTSNREESQLEMAKKLELKFDDFVSLKEYCDKVGIIFLTTPFDFESADSISDLVDIIKLSSGEVTNLPFLKHAAKKGKPILMSTGMCNFAEVEKAGSTIIDNQPHFTSDFPPITLLHCTTNYPCPYALRCGYDHGSRYSLQYACPKTAWL